LKAYVLLLALMIIASFADWKRLLMLTYGTIVVWALCQLDWIFSWIININITRWLLIRSP